jgi:cytoskeletal protein CcmA (bactofilin family)
MWGTKKTGEPKVAVSEPKNVLPKINTTEAMHPLNQTEESQTGLLGLSLRVKGDISGTEDLRIDGSIEGRIQLPDRKLTVGTTAKLKADINARDVIVCGDVQGNVHATGKIEIKKGGSVHGDLTTAQILIEDGADFIGSIKIDRGVEKEADKNVPLRSAAAAGTG